MSDTFGVFVNLFFMIFFLAFGVYDFHKGNQWMFICDCIMFYWCFRDYLAAMFPEKFNKFLYTYV